MSVRKTALIVTWFMGFGFAVSQPIQTEERPAPGLRYEHRRLDGPVSVHIVEVDPQQVEVFAGRALNDGVGRETVSSIARRNGAAAAVNGSFFGQGGRYDGDPSGILRIDGKWFSDASMPRGVIGWTGGGRQAQIGRLMTGWSLTAGGATLSISGINRTRAEREAILYTWAFHRTTLTNPGGIEILIEDGKVLGIVEGGDSEIPVGGYVVSLGPRFEGGSWRTLAPGTEVSLDIQYQADPSRDWRGMNFAVGGTPVLVEDGELVEDYSSEKVSTGFVEQPHPRTAVGLRDDGSWVFVVVDGRQPDVSGGMTLKELARFMLSLGCKSALNMDGGGSSTLYLMGRIVNSPSDLSGERPVSDAILVRLLKTPE